MFNIVLYEPEIPPNTGNIIRLCANTGCTLHLIEPLGFEPDDKQLKRAGLDYHDWAQCKRYKNFQDFLETASPTRLFCATTKGTQAYTDVTYQQHDFFLYGPESRGLPADILTTYANTTLYIPMKITDRSLNLANAVSIITYEAWRQLGFELS